MKKPRVSEKSVEAEIRTMLELNGWRTWKTDVFAGAQIAYEHKGKVSHRRFSEGIVGQPDLIATRPFYVGDSRGGQILLVECKAPDGKLTAAQKACHRVLEKEGYLVLTARSWADLLARAMSKGLFIGRKG